MKKERRTYTRYKLDLPIDVILKDEVLFTARSLDVSLAGLRLICNKNQAREILPSTLQVSPAGKKLPSSLKLMQLTSR